MSLTAYRDLLLRWNERVNLTAARTAAEVDEHIEDCFHVVAHLPATGRLIDVGAGGGLPCVVIAIALPELAITALEPTHKKHAFLRTAARELGLPNLDPRAERWEDHAAHDYDAAVSRATLDLATWLAIGTELVRPGGTILAMEGAELLTPLPPGVERHPYELHHKTRAILSKIK